MPNRAKSLPVSSNAAHETQTHSDSNRGREPPNATRNTNTSAAVAPICANGMIVAPTALNRSTFVTSDSTASGAASAGREPKSAAAKNGRYAYDRAMPTLMAMITGTTAS